MADEIPPAPSETEDASKAETIRITLPPRQEQQAIKRETVRISLPGKPSSIPPAGIAPKKETTKLGATATPEGDVDTSATVAKPFTPPSPPSAPSIPPAKPIGGIAPPKPPSFGARPTVPLKPAPPPSAPAASAPAPAPLAQKAAAPKKETARITLPAEGAAKPALPKATVKMQQTQPLVNRPAPTLTPSAAITASAAGGLPAEPDSMQNMMSWAAAILSVVAFLLVFLAYSAASPQ